MNKERKVSKREKELEKKLKAKKPFLCKFCNKYFEYKEMFEKGLCMECYQTNSKRAKNLEIKREIKAIDLFDEEQNVFEDLIDVLQELGVNLTFKNIKIINKFIVRTLKRLK